MFETVQKLAIAVLVGMAVVGAVQDWSNDVPSVTAGYYEQTQTGGEIEADYTAMGEYEVAHAEYPAQDVLVKQYEVWYPALLKGLAGIPGLYGQYLRLAARRKSPALACLPLRLRGAK